MDGLEAPASEETSLDGAAASAGETTGAQTGPRIRSTRSPTAQILAVLLVIGIFAGILPQLVDLAAVWRAITGRVTAAEAVVMAGFTAASLVASFLALMAALPGLGFRHAAMVNVASTAAAYALPAGGPAGGAVNVWMLRSLGFAPSAIATQMLVTGLWNLYVKLGLPVVALAVLAFVTTDQPGLVAAAVLGLVALAVTVALLGLVLWREATAVGVGRVALRVTGGLLRLVRRPAPERDVAGGLIRFRRRVIGLVVTRWPWLTLSTLGYHLSLFGVLWSALSAVGAVGVSLPEALAVFAIARQLTVLPITPGGAGVVELGLIAGLHAAGGELEAVAAAVLLFRFLTYLLYLPAGVLVHLAWRRRLRAASGRPVDKGPSLGDGTALARYAHHPGDLARTVLGLLALPLLGLFAAQGRVIGLELGTFRFLNGLPDVLLPVLGAVMQAGWLGAVPIVAAGAALVRRRRLAVDLLGGGVLAWLLAKVVKDVVARGRPAQIFDEVVLRGVSEAGLGFISGHAAVAAALATVASGHVRRPVRWAMWTIVWLVAVSRVYVGAHLPLDVIGGVAFGWAVGGIIHLVRGTPAHLPSSGAVAHALGRLGLEPADVRMVATDAKGSVPFLVSTADGAKLFVKAIGRDQRDADALFKLSRYLLFHEVEDQAPFATPKQQLEHEAYVSLLAARSGARVPAVHLTGNIEGRVWLLVSEFVDGRPLGSLGSDELDATLLDEVWQQVVRLRAGRIAHRDLRLANVLVDRAGRPWLVDFGFAEAGASDRQLARDVAELMTSTAVVVGAPRAVAAAVRNLGTDAVAAAASLVQPLAVTWTTRRQLRGQPGLLAEIRAEIARATGSPLTPEPLVRVHLRPGTLLAVVLSGYVIHYVSVEVTGAAGAGDLLERLRWRWTVAALAAMVATYLASAAALMAAFRQSLGFGRTAAVQLASSFASKMAPAGLGTLAVNSDYLRNTGAGEHEASEAVAVVRAAGIAVHALALVASTAIAVAGGIRAGSLPRSWWVLAVVAAAVAVAGLVWWRPLRRSSLAAAMVDGMRALPEVLSRPGRALGLLLGTLGVTAGYVFSLYATLKALGQGPPVAAVVALYLIVTALAVMGPLPGGLGLVEPALTVGLVMIGLRPVPAVVAVMLFRIVSYWLPIGPAAWTLGRLRRSGVLVAS